MRARVRQSLVLAGFALLAGAFDAEPTRAAESIRMQALLKAIVAPLAAG